MGNQKIKVIKYFIRDSVLLVAYIGILIGGPIAVFRFVPLKGLIKILEDNNFGWLNFMLADYSELSYIIIRVFVILIFWVISSKGLNEIIKNIQPIGTDKQFYVKSVWVIRIDRFLTNSTLFNPVNKSIGVQFYVWLHEDKFRIDQSLENGMDLPEKIRELDVKKDLNKMERLNKNFNLLLGDTYEITVNQLPITVSQNNYILINRKRQQTEGNIREKDTVFLNEITKVLKETTEGQNYDTINFFANVNPFHLRKLIQNNFSFVGRNTDKNHNFKMIRIYQYNPNTRKFGKPIVELRL